MVTGAGSACCLLDTSMYIKVGRNQQQHISGMIAPASRSTHLAKCEKKCLKEAVTSLGWSENHPTKAAQHGVPWTSSGLPTTASLQHICHCPQVGDEEGQLVAVGCCRERRFIYFHILMPIISSAAILQEPLHQASRQVRPNPVLQGRVRGSEFLAHGPIHF